MRTIKFRTWDTINKRFVDPDIYRAISFDGKVVYADTDSHGFYGMNKEDGMEIMQFTGILDKNGREIYEGDILKLDQETRKVYDSVGSDGSGIRENQVVGFYKGVFMTSRRLPANVREDFDTYLCIISGASEVVGNIYENPGLLK